MFIPVCVYVCVYVCLCHVCVYLSVSHLCVCVRVHAYMLAITWQNGQAGEPEMYFNFVWP